MRASKVSVVALVRESSSTSLHRACVILRYFGKSSDSGADATLALRDVLSEREGVERELIRTRLHGGPNTVQELAKRKRRLTAKARRLAPVVLAAAERYEFAVNSGAR